MSSRKRTLKQAFLVTVAAAVTATGAAACGNAVSFPEDEEEVILEPCTGDCQGGCPSAKPEDGSICFGEGLTCYYGDVCEESTATCDGGTWDVQDFTGSCNPPPPECPAAQPEVGEICEYQPDSWGGYADWCGYAVQTPCGEANMVMGCQNDPNTNEMVWAVQEPPPSCELPPEECQLYEGEAACSADAGCQWLVPGCTDGPNAVAEGCYPVDDCTETGCGDWGECVTMVHDPCYNSTCGSCAAEIAVCLGVDNTGTP